MESGLIIALSQLQNLRNSYQNNQTGEHPQFFVSIMKITAWDRVCSFGGLSFWGARRDVERIEYL
jgi:hypothetical protein